MAPVLPHKENGTFTLCVKTYFPTDGGPYPPGGLVSNYLDCMKLGGEIPDSMILRSLLMWRHVGEEIDIRGPEGGIIYKGHSDFEIDGQEYHFDKVRNDV